VLAELAAEEQQIAEATAAAEAERAALVERTERLVAEQQREYGVDPAALLPEAGTASPSPQSSVDACAAATQARRAEEQRAEMAAIEARLCEGWARMDKLGLREQAIKHRLAHLARIEAAVPYSKSVLVAYRAKLAELEDALPVFQALRERESLQRSVELCRGLVKEHEVEDAAQAPRLKETLRMLEREAAALRITTVRAAKLVQAWEAKHGERFTF
jgi:hypothetical protein